MYESPITIVTQKLRKAISEQYDDYIMATVEEALGCEVNKEELIKALKYDRDQYNKGFRDGQNYMEHTPSPINDTIQVEDMKKFIVIGKYSHIIETESWEAAFRQAWRMVGNHLVSITEIPEEEDE